MNVIVLIAEGFSAGLSKYPSVKCVSAVNNCKLNGLSDAAKREASSRANWNNFLSS